MAARTAAARVCALLLACAVVAGGLPAAGSPSSQQIVAIHRALEYLQGQQVVEPLDLWIGDQRIIDYPGNWPQHFRFQGLLIPWVRDVSPFIATFIHHALTPISEQHRRRLRLTSRDLRAARRMRKRAVDFLERFESRRGDPDAGTFGFWPYDAHPDSPPPELSGALVAWLGGPILGGSRVPLNLPIFPDPLAIPADADVTAAVYAALLDDAALDCGPGTAVAYERFFADWRDLGQVPRRLNPSWLPPASGAFLTWLAYRESGAPVRPNDIDLVVNANVLFALGRGGRLATPGVAEAVELIGDAVALGLHRDRFGEIAEYYPDNLTFQYAVSRAYREGGVRGLASAVEVLADDLEATAIGRPDGTVFWDRGAPQLNTAFAVLTLLNAGRDSPLIGRAAAYLVSQQNFLGGYEPAVFFIAPADNGQVFEFFSSSFTTAMVLEALTRHALAREP